MKKEVSKAPSLGKGVREQMKNSNAVYYHQFNQEELKEALQGLYGEGIFKKKEKEKKYPRRELTSSIS
jgi:hypothetical protein